jgi:uncharacterized membrane protein
MAEQTNTSTKSWTSFLTSNAVIGLLVLVPIAILFLVVMQIYGLLDEAANFAELSLPFPSFVNGAIFVVLCALAVFALCFLTGMLMLTGPGKKFAEFVNKSITDKVPLLGLVRKLTLSVTGAHSRLKPVEADVHDSGAPMFGFLMETLSDGRHIVFVPTSPTITLGHTYIVPPERVTLLDAPVTAVVNALTQWGAGAQEIYQTDGASTADDDSKDPES